MKTTIALGLPHTPWVPERVESFARLLGQLGVIGFVYHDGSADHTRVFQDKESNRVWPQKLWRWAVSTGATHLLQLQDDALVYEHFWPVLRAMIEAQPDKIIGLESNHPLGPEMLRTGRRWYRSRAWLVGVGYVFPTDPKLPNSLPSFLKWCDANPEIVAQNNEDSLVNFWAHKLGYDIWHPIPTIIDHDLGVPSTYANDAHHEFSMYRRPTVTWRDVELRVGMEDPAYWRTTVDGAPLLPGPGTQLCWFCNVRQGVATSQETGARICKECATQTMCALLGIKIQFPPPATVLPPDKSSLVRRPPCEECGAEGGYHLDGCEVIENGLEGRPGIPPDRPRINP